MNYEKASQPFSDAGISPKWLLPIAPLGAVISKNTHLNEKVLGKAPGRYNARKDEWSGLGGSYIVTGVRKEEFDEMRDWPTGNVGILGKAYPGIDSDAVDEKSRLLVERVIAKVFGADGYGKRIRGKGPRRLYAFVAKDHKDPQSVVRTRHLSFRLGHQEKDDLLNKLDIIGLGGQYVITGDHPSGDKYGWDKSASLADPEFVDRLEPIDNEDISYFIEELEKAIKDAGGEIVTFRGNSTGGEEFDLSKLDPIMPVDALLDGLDRVPNNEDNFPHRDDFVSMLAMIRAALGKESFKSDVEEKIREWATEDYEFCDDEYFEKAWESLDRVRVNQNAIERVFKSNGYTGHIKHQFKDDVSTVSKEITKNKKERKNDKDDILDEVESLYIFGRVNTREGKVRSQMRSVWDVDHEWASYDWFRFELAESNPDLLARIHSFDGWGPNKIGHANFLRDLQKRHPDSFYSDETKNPNFNKGEIVTDTYSDGSLTRKLNMRRMSDTIREAAKADKNPERSKDDVAHILDFMRRMFRDQFKYEMSTLAFMAQTGDRPGHMLFLVGDTGVGKSIFLDMLTTMFDGTGPEINSRLDGAKLMNESARRFMLAQAEGSRILTVRELPEGKGTPAQMAAITSMLKQIVDPGREADYLPIERKGVDSRPVQNFARVVISSNYRDAIHVEAQDRRIFYIAAGINETNKPSEAYYKRLVDIIQEPKRLAAFYRYLLKQDITDYTRYTAPPETNAKREQIAIESPTPMDRHFMAAMELLRVANRQIFSATELREIMTEMADNEYKNTRGEIDDRFKYADHKDTATAMAVSRKIPKKIAMKVDVNMRTSKSFGGSYFVFNEASELREKLEKWNDRQMVYEYYDKDRETHGLPQHPWPNFKYSD